MLQAKPGATPAQLNAALKQTAIDMGTAGFDFDSGYGLIQADAAVAEIITTSIIIPPVAAFTYECSGSVCLFDGSGSNDDVAVTSYTWDFGDGAGSIEQSPTTTTTHTYAGQGNYTVTLVVADAEFASDTASATIRVKRKGDTSGSSGDGGGSTVEAEKGRKKCTDGIDNDGDGLIDGADPDCNR
jgi:PKD repeat protein